MGRKTWRMTTQGSVDDPSSAPQGAGESPRSRLRTLAVAVRRRFEGSPAQTFIRHLAALDFTNTVVLFGAALLISVLPFIILLSSLANHQVDSDLSRHIRLNSQGARIVSQLFRASPAHPAGDIAATLIFATVGTM